MGLSRHAIATKGVNTAATSYADSTSAVIPFPTVIRNNDGGGLVGATGLWTCQRTGWYQISANVEFLVHILSLLVQIFVTRDGLHPIKLIKQDQFSHTTDKALSVVTRDHYYFVEGDVVSCFLTQKNTGAGAKTLDTRSNNVSFTAIFKGE